MSQKKVWFKLDGIIERLFKFEITDLILSLLLIIFSSRYMFVSCSNMIRIIFSSFLIIQLVKMLLHTEYKEIIYFNIIMTLSIIILNTKILLLGEFSFSFTYMSAHLITQLLILYSFYLSDTKMFYGERYKLLIALSVIFVIYVISYKFERTIFDMLNILYYIIYFCIWVLVLLLNIKKRKYYNHIQKKIQIVVFMFTLIIFIATMIFNEFGLFFEGNKLLAWNNIALILINEVVINTKANTYNVLILFKMILSYFISYSLLKLGRTTNYYIGIFLLIILVVDIVLKYTKRCNYNQIEDVIAYEEKTKEFADYIHDEILQDILNIKRQTDMEESKILINELINKIRENMDYYSPQIFPQISLKDNYRMLIKTISEKHSHRKIVVDFYCDDDLYLSNPYDIFIYKCLRECLNNIYKHTESIFVTINLEIIEQKIFLTIENDEGFFDPEKISSTNIGRGWSYIKLGLDKFGGSFTIKSSNPTKVKIEVPINGRGIYLENIINR